MCLTSYIWTILTNENNNIADVLGLEYPERIRIKNTAKNIRHHKKPTSGEEGEEIIGEEKEGYPVCGVVDAEDAVEVVSPERDAQPTLPARAEGPGPHLNRTHLPSKCRLCENCIFHYNAVPDPVFLHVKKKKI